MIEDSNKNTEQTVKGVFIKGQISDSEGKPIPQALIEFLNTGLKTHTNTEGEYSFTDVPVGHDILRVIATGFIQIREPFEITENLENYIIIMKISI